MDICHHVWSHKVGHKVIYIIRNKTLKLFHAFTVIFTSHPQMRYFLILESTRVQRRATKTVPSISTMSYSDRLRTLRLPSLVYRRARGDMIETYKFLHNVYDLNNERLRRDPSTRTRCHSLKLEKRRCQTTMRQHCFSNRV